MVEVNLTCRNYQPILALLESFKTANNQNNHALQGKLAQITDRHVGHLLLRALTPLDKKRNADLPEPSILHQDQLVLPTVTRAGLTVAEVEAKLEE